MNFTGKSKDDIFKNEHNQNIEIVKIDKWVVWYHIVEVRNGIITPISKVFCKAY